MAGLPDIDFQIASKAMLPLYVFKLSKILGVSQKNAESIFTRFIGDQFLEETVDLKGLSMNEFRKLLTEKSGNWLQGRRKAPPRQGCPSV